jgi:hypothetical protein
MDIETLRHEQIMNKLQIIEKKNNIIFKNSYVFIDKYFIYDAIMYSCLCFAVIGCTVNYFNFL